MEMIFKIENEIIFHIRFFTYRYQTILFCKRSKTNRPIHVNSRLVRLFMFIVRLFLCVCDVQTQIGVDIRADKIVFQSTDKLSARFDMKITLRVLT